MSDFSKSSKILGLEILVSKGINVPSFTFIPDFTGLGIDSIVNIDKFYNRDKILSALRIAQEKIGSCEQGYSLRSASFDEDSSHQSAAGRYMSYNGVNSLDKLYRAALMIWKQHRSLSPNVLCPLILQKTHGSYFSGVAFKNRPEEGSAIVIESYYGSCRSLVNGTVPPYRSIYQQGKWTHQFESERLDCYIFNAHRSLFQNNSLNQLAGARLTPVMTPFPRQIHLYMQPYSSEFSIYGYRIEEPPVWYTEKICEPMAEILNRLEAGEGVDVEWGTSMDGTLTFYQFRPLVRPLLLHSVQEQSSPAINSTGLQKIYRGLPASEGLVRGVISTNIDAVTPDTILMLKCASADKLEALETCRGVITSVGGMLSHLALICRELKKPCVVGIHSTIPDGTFVVMDGSYGIVELID